jgi:hypothetical protein
MLEDASPDAQQSIPPRVSNRIQTKDRSLVIRRSGPSEALSEGR